MLAALIRKHGADCWLVNTGWTGGGAGTGERMRIQHTRTLLNAVLDGTLRHARMERDPFFGLMFPQDVPGIPNEVLNPRLAWTDKAAYERQAADLVARFEKNFSGFHDLVDEDVRAAAIRVAA
jgi:phosphoenolpyruvate carboxykinase (ATP)